MSSHVVRLEVVPVSNKLSYEKSLIGQLFSGPEAAHPAVPKVKSPFPLRAANDNAADRLVRPSAETPPLEETHPPIRYAPQETEHRQETPPPVSASPTPKGYSESPTSRRSPALTTLPNAANKKAAKKMKINLTKGEFWFTACPTGDSGFSGAVLPKTLTSTCFSFLHFSSLHFTFLLFSSCLF